MSRHLEDSIFGNDGGRDRRRGDPHDEVFDHEHDDHHHGSADEVHPDDVHRDDVHPDDVRVDQVSRADLRARRARQSRAHSRHDEGGGLKRILVPLVALGLLAGLAIGAYAVISPLIERATTASAIEDYPGPGSGEATVTVSPGDDGGVIARNLVDAGVIASTRAFLRASNDDPAAAAAVQPGEYTLLQEMSAAEALAALNDPANRYLGERVTIREGLWKSEVFAALSEATGIPVEDYEAAAQDGAAIGLPEQAEGDVEGWLFPATYTLRTDDSPEQHLSVLIDEMKSQLSAAGAPEDQWQRVLTIAAMVEGEARDPEDAGKVARVIENRLSDPTGPTVGYLQMDSTVNYALQKRGNLTRAEYEEAKSNPYDTYAFSGLPPGPIGNPGRMAIDAATNPPEGDWFFFVTVNLDTGETLFAETFEEHTANDRQRVQWCEDNPGKCTGAR